MFQFKYFLYHEYLKWLLLIKMRLATDGVKMVEIKERFELETLKSFNEQPCGQFSGFGMDAEGRSVLFTCSPNLRQVKRIVLDFMGFDH